MIKIIQRCKAAADQYGSRVRYFEVGETLDVSEPWQAKIAQQLIDSGFAAETKVVEVKETKTRKPKKK